MKIFYPFFQYFHVPNQSHYISLKANALHGKRIARDRQKLYSNYIDFRQCIVKGG